MILRHDLLSMANWFMDPDGLKESLNAILVPQSDATVSCFAASHGDRRRSVLERSERRTRVALALQKRHQVPGQYVFGGENAVGLQRAKENLETHKRGVVCRVISVLVRTPNGVQCRKTNPLKASKLPDEIPASERSRILNA